VVTSEQRKEMFYKTRDLVKKGYFVADFWNSGLVSDGCISAGRSGGYLYIEWNGNVTPCAFNPYAVANINEIYKKGENLNDVLNKSFFQKIRRWQDDYASKQGNWILPCPIRDHYKEMREFIDEDKPQPIDNSAKQALQDKKYTEKMINYDKDLAKVFNPIWEKEYKKSKKVKN
jgi:MoaA/NifB/PqqE/SkfB family radical SAM enzyme